jgi:hypothetical protein
MDILPTVSVACSLVLMHSETNDTCGKYATAIRASFDQAVSRASRLTNKYMKITALVSAWHDAL